MKNAMFCEMRDFFINFHRLTLNDLYGLYGSTVARNLAYVCLSMS